MFSPVPFKIANFIDGQFFDKEHSFESFNPSKGSVNAWIPDSNEQDVQLATDAALKAFKTWSKTSEMSRIKILNKIADLIEENLDELAKLESEDQGKPLLVSKSVDIPRSVLNFRHFANCLSYQSDHSIVDHEAGIINYVTRHPVGVVGIITPWNLPLYLLTFKLAPAIAFGNTVVAKPSELTSMTAFRLCQILNDAGLPKGVINMVFGYGNKVGEAIVKHPSIKLISFTGSTITGQKIAQQAAPLFKRLSLEMGGKNAAIVFDDVNLEKELIHIARSAYFNSGQICLASSRILVHESIYAEFVEKFIKISREFIIGDPFDKETKLGPLVSAQHRDKVLRYINLARNTDKVKMTYLEPNYLNKNGYFCGIAIVSDIEIDSPLMMEEIFGPVVCIVQFKDEQEAIEIANNTNYGLSATVWTQSLDRMHRVSHQIEAGTVWGNCWLVRNLNMPFGGIKQSGIGHESTEDSREFYTNKKTICIKI
ncbi:Aldehyde dehydrogenase 8 member A1 [Dermatophagoides pteronyssinus]|uniref:Aldehyde dehydrogenase 8 member A1 n=1 Tax=Dermatophagoides pteronyssinus TaxID=6956 RepID=A0ABQ8IS14_DERPT|nr:Aldehyde dehydrogenase 8 member A1 [Dermatophagoides pteronyssinus]